MLYKQCSIKIFTFANLLKCHFDEKKLKQGF